MLIDAFLPECVTHLAVDSIFMMPQLGVLSTVHPKAATEVFKKDCLIHLGTCIAPVGTGKEGSECVRVKLEREQGSSEEVAVNFGQMKVMTLAVGEKARVLINPTKGFDAGAGPGRRRSRSGPPSLRRGLR